MSKLTGLDIRYGSPGRELQFKMAFDLTHFTQGFIYRFLAAGQLCDPPLVQALTSFLQPGDTFIDVGSHIGYYSLLALQHVGPNGRVFAFEPNPQTFSMLISNVMLNRAQNFHAFNCAVGSKPGTASFHMNTHDEGTSSLVFRGKNSSQITVAVTTLDKFAQTISLGPVRMLKVDVEGFEEDVLQGGRQWIARGSVENIVFELNNNFPGIPKNRDQAVRQALRSLGYTSYLIRPWLGDKDWEEKCGTSNYLRIPEDRTIDIPYGNVLATKRPIEAPVLT